jgi:hypothetical protein
VICRIGAVRGRESRQIESKFSILLRHLLSLKNLDEI